MTHPLIKKLAEVSLPLSEQAKHIIDRAKPLLENTRSTFPTGTDHTSLHTITVEVIASILLPDSFLAELNPFELFFLTASCHYHDLGMAGTEADEASEITREHARRTHSVHIGDRIRNEWANLGFENERIATILGEICRGHRPKRDKFGIVNWDELPSIGVIAADTSVRVHLLAALIYAIDELHIGADRAPRRTERWRNITNLESRRHWTRHQAIHGPALSTSDTLLYQICVNTPGFEEKLRSQVLLKALTSLNELREQTKKGGISTSIRNVSIQWNRLDSYKLLLIISCSDLIFRTKDEIIDCIISLYRYETSDQTVINSYCEELCSHESRLKEITRVVDDAIIYDDLTVDKNRRTHFALSDNEITLSKAIALADSADDTDKLFFGRYHKSWKTRILDSNYYRRYIRESCLKKIDAAYSVQIGELPPNDPLLILFERCPSASQQVIGNVPRLSNLSKDSLVEQLAIAGALIDLYDDPIRILDQELRSAIHTLTDKSESIKSTIRLFEELALIDGLGSNQSPGEEDVKSAITLSSEDTNNRASVTLSQNIDPTDQSNIFHLNKLLLASQRSKTPIILCDTSEQKIDIDTNQSGKSTLQNHAKTIRITPSESHSWGHAYLPASVIIVDRKNTVELHLRRFGAELISELPLIIRLPPPPSAGNSVPVTFGISINWPYLTIIDLVTIHKVNQILHNANATLELILQDDQLLASTTTTPPFKAFELLHWSDNTIDLLKDLDQSLPLPLLMSPKDIEHHTRSLTIKDRNEWWSGQEKRNDRPVCYPVYIKITNTAGRVIEESFLCILPENPFSPPQVDSNDEMSQEELNEKWNAGSDDFRIQAFFDIELNGAVESLKTWLEHTDTEFPFRFDFGDRITPPISNRTAIAIILGRTQNRHWHDQRSLIFEFRPINRFEAYDLEAKYWKYANDYPRQLLAEEIRDRYKSELPRDPHEPGGLN